MPQNTRITLALARFEAALQAFEACAARLEAGERADRGALEAELRELRGQAADLAQNNREAGLRVDTAIAKIRAALGG